MRKNKILLAGLLCVLWLGATPVSLAQKKEALKAIDPSQAEYDTPPPPSPAPAANQGSNPFGSGIQGQPLGASKRTLQNPNPPGSYYLPDNTPPPGMGSVPGNPAQPGQGWSPSASAGDTSGYERRVQRLEQMTFGSPYPEHDVEDRIDHLENEVFSKKNTGMPVDQRLARLETKLLGQTAFGQSSPAPPPSLTTAAHPQSNSPQHGSSLLPAPATAWTGASSGYSGQGASSGYYPVTQPQFSPGQPVYQQYPAQQGYPVRPLYGTPPQSMPPYGGSQQGMLPYGGQAQKGMMPFGTQQGMPPYGATQPGMPPYGVTQQGMSSYGSQQGMPPYGTVQQGMQRMPPYGAAQPGMQGSPSYGTAQPGGQGSLPYGTAQPGMQGSLPYGTAQPGMQGSLPYGTAQPGMQGTLPYGTAQPGMQGTLPYGTAQPGMQGTLPYGTAQPGMPVQQQGILTQPPISSSSVPSNTLPPEVVVPGKQLGLSPSDRANADIENIVKSIPLKPGAGDYFAAINKFTAGSVARWTSFPVLVHLPQGSPSNWQKTLEDAVGNWGRYIPVRAAAPSETSDIEIAWINHLPPRTLGQTNLEIFNGHMRVTVYLLRPSYYLPNTSEKVLRKAAEHEVGHAIGIFGHSTDPADLMYPMENASPKDSAKYGGITSRDLNTLRRIYESPALPPGFQSPHPMGWSFGAN